eukprot:PLAT12521.43.p2 GENE.PLAT12521.43~~PLAT12521.43.p2  ORF type:complete len:472 (+),score=252.24 PLAT12521.43:591-2006(+)
MAAVPAALPCWAAAPRPRPQQQRQQQQQRRPSVKVPTAAAGSDADASAVRGRLRPASAPAVRSSTIASELAASMPRLLSSATAGSVRLKEHATAAEVLAAVRTAVRAVSAGSSLRQLFDSFPRQQVKLATHPVRSTARAMLRGSAPARERRAGLVRKEFEAGVRTLLGMSLTFPQFDELFRGMCNDAHLITWPRFKAALSGGAGDAASQRENVSIALLRRLSEAVGDAGATFDLMDVARRRSLSASQFTGMLRALDIGLDKKQIYSIMEVVDTCADRSVTRDEFVAYFDTLRASLAESEAKLEAAAAAEEEHALPSSPVASDRPARPFTSPARVLLGGRMSGGSGSGSGSGESTVEVEALQKAVRLLSGERRNVDVVLKATKSAVQLLLARGEAPTSAALASVMPAGLPKLMEEETLLSVLRNVSAMRQRSTSAATKQLSMFVDELTADLARLHKKRRKLMRKVAAVDSSE